MAVASEGEIAVGGVEVGSCGVAGRGCVSSGCGSLSCGVGCDGEGREQEKIENETSFKSDFAFCISRVRAPAPHQYKRIESENAHGQLVCVDCGSSKTTP